MNNKYDRYAIEFLKCKQNPLYFIYNYVNISEIGGVLKLDKDNFHPKMKQTVKAIYKYNRCILMASRQLGKSTTAAAILTWAINFYSGIPIIIINMQKGSALENLNKVKFIHSNLPSWLKSPIKGRAERKTYLELENGSIIRVFYPASTASPNQIARSLTSPILYIDEAAHIRHISIAYRSAQPVLSKAREQAKKNNYPTFILMTSTPNGVVGEGKFFSDMWSNAIDANDIFDENNNFVKNSDIIVNDPSKNGFIKIKFHWSDDPTKDDNWYNEQKRELNFDLRSINQELDLLFIGSTSCIFDDLFLSKLNSKKPIKKIELSHFAYLKLYKEINPKNFYIIGIDTAKSLTGDYCAIEIFDYDKFEQVGEFFSKLGSLKKFTDIIIEIIDLFVDKTKGNFILAIENNSIGSAIIELLEDDYSNYLYSDDEKEFKYGINTNSKTKDQMITIFFDYINSSPELIHSSDLIEQLSVIEKKHNGSVSAKSGYHDDLFMACCFCAYVRRNIDGIYDKDEIKFDPLITQIKKINYQEDEILEENDDDIYENYENENDLIF